MRNLLRRIFQRKKVKIPVAVPERYGPKPTLAELKLALEHQTENPQIRAVVHLLLMYRTRASISARGAARVDKPPTFDLGGADYLDEVFTELDALVNAEPSSGLVEGWFAAEEKAKIS